MAPNVQPGTADSLRIELAGQPHVHQFIQTWVPSYLIKKGTVKGWPYRLFHWHQIIPFPDLETYAAVSLQNVEGFVAISQDLDSFKVNFLAAAPWNFEPQKQIRGVGSRLLAFAVGMSMERNLGGELFLSSTPESESFYEYLHLDRTGERDDEDLAVFRLSPERAQEILIKYSPSPQAQESEVR